MKTGALLLAAGFSSRFGGSKLSAALQNGNTVLQQTLHEIRTATQNVVIVSRPELIAAGLFETLPASNKTDADAQQLEYPLPGRRKPTGPLRKGNESPSTPPSPSKGQPLTITAQEHCTILLCEDARKGMGHSLAFGAQHLTHWDACLVCLADMPFIRAETYAALLAALRPDRIVIPEFQQQPGHPIGFGREFFPELSRLTGDMGGRALIQKHAAQVLRVPVNDPAILWDVDTPEDLACRQSQLSQADPF